MPKISKTPEEITARRRATALRSYSRLGATILKEAYCPDTGGGVAVLTYPHHPHRADEALLFRARSFNRFFKTVPVRSAHERLDPLRLLKAEMAAEKARKRAPHDLAPGAILARIWGYTSRDVDFLKVVDVEPRAVHVIKLPARFASGDWMSGTKIPADISPDKEADLPRERHEVSMETGEATLKTRSSIETTRRWDGEPVHVHCD